MKTVTETQFEREVLQSDLPVVVDFYADWCPPCRAVAPVMEQLAQEYQGRVKVVKVNVEKEQRLAQRYQILSIPTILFFKNGEPVDGVLGAQAYDVLKDHFEELN
jgi:thioredoxin 1